MSDAPPGILSPRNDFVFKRIFGDANDVEPLAAFLQAALGLPEEEFADLAVIDPNLNSEFEGDKHCILDVRIRTRSGRDIDVEIQVKPTDDIYNRIQCYTAKMVAGQVKAGESYGVMAQSITIVITDFWMWRADRGYHHRFRLYDSDAGLPYPDSMEIHTLELPKLPENSDGSKLWDWLKFLSSETVEEFESLAGKDAVMAKAYGKLAVLSEDEKARYRAEAYGKWLWDENSRIRQSRREGLEEGLEKGLARGRQEKLQIALRLLRMNMALADIVNVTGLPEAEIELLSKTEETATETVLQE